MPSKSSRSARGMTVPKRVFRDISQSPMRTRSSASRQVGAGLLSPNVSMNKRPRMSIGMSGASPAVRKPSSKFKIPRKPRNDENNKNAIDENINMVQSPALRGSARKRHQVGMMKEKLLQASAKRRAIQKRLNSMIGNTPNKNNIESNKKVFKRVRTNKMFSPETIKPVAIAQPKTPVRDVVSEDTSKQDPVPISPEEAPRRLDFGNISISDEATASMVSQAPLTVLDTSLNDSTCSDDDEVAVRVILNPVVQSTKQVYKPRPRETTCTDEISTCIIM